MCDCSGALLVFPPVQPAPPASELVASLPVDRGVSVEAASGRAGRAGGAPLFVSGRYITVCGVLASTRVVAWRKPLLGARRGIRE